ncbi:hypothetical protein NVP1052A_44 [Vibrio phage 1.052.A._10N.286.46.C3]|nr:hypothetical protein NVP1052A_44 [Vibrio phage 1.052.A._10N.286.46.C3]
MEKQLVSQWHAKGEMAEWLRACKQKHGTITAYIRGLIAADMKRK